MGLLSGLAAMAVCLRDGRERAPAVEQDMSTHKHLLGRRNTQTDRQKNRQKNRHTLKETHTHTHTNPPTHTHTV